VKFVKSKLEPVMIEIDGAEYPGILNFRALAELEELSGCSFMAVFTRFSEGNLYVNDIINILYASLKEAGVEIELDDLMQLNFTKDFLVKTIKGITNLIETTQKVESVIDDSAKIKTSAKK
jgi:hypothetical protein